jgi:hypothetical protein
LGFYRGRLRVEEITSDEHRIGTPLPGKVHKLFEHPLLLLQSFEAPEAFAQVPIRRMQNPQHAVAMPVQRKVSNC